MTTKLHPSLTEERVMEAIGHYPPLCFPGFCVLCGADVEDVEPGARGQYRCKACGKRGVWSAEELLIRLPIPHD
jgi:hypothetical protein